jgi:hypothetical protein
MAKKTTRRNVSKLASSDEAKPSKAGAVREYLTANPQAKGKEVVAALKVKGITISPNYVSMIKSKNLAKSSRKPGVPKSDISSHGQLEMALELARACRWDFESARHFLGMIETVHKSLS